MRDAALHAVALGFVFAMVFGHAPIIFPSVTRVRIPYRPLFYLPLATLNIALACRIAGSLVASALHLRQHGALATALAILLFILTLAFSIWRGAGKSTLLPIDGRVP